MRVLVWFSCGAASAVAAKLAVDKYGDLVEVCYCNTLSNEHPDNQRFMDDVSQWIGKKITVLNSKMYSDPWDVWTKTRWLVGPKGARCTTELKKALRNAHQRPDDIQVFGFTKDEEKRWNLFIKNNPEVATERILKNHTKADCLRTIRDAGIELPEMYKLGYKNNNCIGCVKGGAGYWNKIRKDFPLVFERMSKLERKLNAAINHKMVGEERVRIFLDELPKDMGDIKKEPDIECGVLCGMEEQSELFKPELLK